MHLQAVVLDPFGTLGLFLECKTLRRMTNQTGLEILQEGGPALVDRHFAPE